MSAAECSQGASWHGSAVVLGPPATKGSAKAFMPKNGRFPVVVNDNPRGKTWQQDLAAAMLRDAPPRPLTEPIALSVVIWMQRPKSHYGTGKNADRLKPSAPTRPSSWPDTDKMLRVVLDAGTGIWYRDDGQVVTVTADKRWADECPPRVLVQARTTR